MPSSLTDKELHVLRSALNDYSAKETNMKEIEELASLFKSNAISKIIDMAQDFECCPHCGYPKAQNHYCKKCKERYSEAYDTYWFYEYLRTIYKDYCPACRKITKTATSVGACVECGED